MMTFSHLIGARIRELRHEKGWSQGELAEEMTRRRHRQSSSSKTVSIDTIGRVERGGNTTIEILEEIAHALGTDLLRLATAVIRDTTPDLVSDVTTETPRLRELRAIADRLLRLEPEDQQVVLRMIDALTPPPDGRPAQSREPFDRN